MLDRTLWQPRNGLRWRGPHMRMSEAHCTFLRLAASSEAGQPTRRPHCLDLWGCHVGNLGPLAHSDGRVEIQIRDLDQAVIGNPTHDLVRLGLSLASAARGSDLPGVTTARILEQIIDGYAAAMEPGQTGDEGDEVPEAMRVAVKTARRRSWQNLAKEQIENIKPTIPLGKRFWPLAADE